jgi:hypothetical protein
MISMEDWVPEELCQELRTSHKLLLLDAASDIKGRFSARAAVIRTNNYLYWMQHMRSKEDWVLEQLWQDTITTFDEHMRSMEDLVPKQLWQDTITTFAEHMRSMEDLVPEQLWQDTITTFAGCSIWDQGKI